MPAGERILKIGKHLAKLVTAANVYVF